MYELDFPNRDTWNNALITRYRACAHWNLWFIAASKKYTFI